MVKLSSQPRGRALSLPTAKRPRSLPPRMSGTPSRPPRFAFGNRRRRTGRLIVSSIGQPFSSRSRASAGAPSMSSIAPAASSEASPSTATMRTERSSPSHRLAREPGAIFSAAATATRPTWAMSSGETRSAPASLSTRSRATAISWRFKLIARLDMISASTKNPGSSGAIVPAHWPWDSGDSRNTAESTSPVVAAGITALRVGV